MKVMQRAFRLGIAAGTLLCAAAISLPAGAATIEVNSINAAFTAPQAWFEADMRGAGTASIQNLSGLGGDLENNASLPTGAALLTTGADNNDKAEIGVADAYGTAGDIIPTLSLSYSFHKVTSGSAAAAPSIKLTFSGDHPTDGFGTLVYEPYWNLDGPGPNPSSVDPTPDVWTDVAIDGDNGLFWWTGGFGQANSFGGAPLRTLNEWLALLDDEFADANLALVSIGVGTFNQGQIGYFDNVRIAHGDGAYDVTYDFEAASVPEPATLALLGLSLAGFGAMRRRRR